MPPLSLGNGSCPLDSEVSTCLRHLKVPHWLSLYRRRASSTVLLVKFFRCNGVVVRELRMLMAALQLRTTFVEEVMAKFPDKDTPLVLFCDASRPTMEKAMGREFGIRSRSLQVSDFDAGQPRIPASPVLVVLTRNNLISKWMIWRLV